MLHRNTQAGFSLVEFLVSATILLILFAMLFSAFLQSRRISERNQADAEILQEARVGLDEMARTLRMIGHGRDRENGQPAIIEAAPFQIIFNANFKNEHEALPAGATFQLYDATTYEVPVTYTTGAETMFWTLDTYPVIVDGMVDKNDINDNIEERETAFNPNDMVLIKRTNAGPYQQVTSNVLGPYNATGQRTDIAPLLQYWVLNADRTFSLVGDTDGNGILENDERYFRSLTSQNILQNIRRLRISLTTESNKKDPFDGEKWRRVTVSTDVSLRSLE